MGHVNVPCRLHTCWTLRNLRVRLGWDMLTFHVGCTHVGCYATDAAAADDLYDPDDDDAVMLMMMVMMIMMMMLMVMVMMMMMMM